MRLSLIIAASLALGTGGCLTKPDVGQSDDGSTGSGSTVAAKAGKPEPAPTSTPGTEILPPEDPRFIDVTCRIEYQKVQFDIVKSGRRCNFAIQWEYGSWYPYPEQPIAQTYKARAARGFRAPRQPQPEPTSSDILPYPYFSQVTYHSCLIQERNDGCHLRIKRPVAFDKHLAIPGYIYAPQTYTRADENKGCMPAIDSPQTEVYPSPWYWDGDVVISDETSPPPPGNPPVVCYQSSGVGGGPDDGGGCFPIDPPTPDFDNTHFYGKITQTYVCAARNWVFTEE